MKELLLLRHCKSSWHDPDIRDHDRPLNARGRGAAPAIGRYIHGEGILPDFILCSSALRAIETIELMMATWPHHPPAVTERDLYMTGRHANLSQLARVADAYNRVMLIGHNPDIESLAATLGRHGSSAAVTAMRSKFPTGALAHITLPIDRWADLPKAVGTLERFITPKALPPQYHSEDTGM